MNIKVLKDSSEIRDAASDLIVQEINLKPNLLLCAATGETPTNTYTKLVDKKELYPTDQIRVLKLDEWVSFSSLRNSFYHAEKLSYS